jgi:hypothetical protein
LVFEKNDNFFAENCDHNIDPRLNEFFTIGSLFTLGSVLKITEVAQFSGQLISTVQLMYSFWHIWIGWATFWATFSKTHLVTLAYDETLFFALLYMRVYSLLQNISGRAVPVQVASSLN